MGTLNLFWRYIINNYTCKNIKHTLNDIETTLLTHDSNTIETVILGGWVSNISNKEHPALAGTDDYFTLQILNSKTLERINLYNEILIKPNTCFPINKINFNEYNHLICNSKFNNNLQLTISYFKITDYNYGFIKVLFEPDNIDSSWNILDIDDIYSNNTYVPILKGIKTIEFEDILGWQRPDSVMVQVQQLKTTEIKSKYTLTDSIITFYNEQINLKDIFQWKLINSDIWLENNQIMTITPGEYEFEFKEINTYIKPDNIILTTLEKTSYTQSITYNLIKESITVNLIPPFYKLSKKNRLYNLWRLIYSNGSISPWYKSGETIDFNTNTIFYLLDIECNNYFNTINPKIEHFKLTLGQPMIFNMELSNV